MLKEQENNFQRSSTSCLQNMYTVDLTNRQELSQFVIQMKWWLKGFYYHAFPNVAIPFHYCKLQKNS